MFTTRSTIGGVLGLVLGLLAAACDGPEPIVPGPDYQEFTERVYPILLRDCGFQACHGDESRYYVVFGPGRLRIDPEADYYDDATQEELVASFEKARSMLLTRGDLSDAPLLRKPLEGGGHMGTQLGGKNVYVSTDDPNYRVLYEWAAAGMDSEEPLGGNP